VCDCATAAVRVVCGAAIREVCLCVCLGGSSVLRSRAESEQEETPPPATSAQHRNREASRNTRNTHTRHKTNTRWRGHWIAGLRLLPRSCTHVFTGRRTAVCLRAVAWRNMAAPEPPHHPEFDELYDSHYDWHDCVDVLDPPAPAPAAAPVPTPAAAPVPTPAAAPAPAPAAAGDPTLHGGSRRHVDPALHVCAKCDVSCECPIITDGVARRRGCLMITDGCRLEVWVPHNNRCAPQ
jgi:hypothetical protein